MLVVKSALLKKLLLLLLCLSYFALTLSEGDETSEGGEGEDSESGEGEETNDRSVQTRFATCIFCLITVLIILSSIFEYMKEKLQESVSENMERVVEVLFSEMTVLGFLSLMTFVIGKVGLLELISEHIFADKEDGRGLLGELLEDVHFDLFLVMVIFIAQTVMLIMLGEQTEERWKHFDHIFLKKEEIEKYRVYLRDAFTGRNPVSKWDFKGQQELEFALELFEHNSLKAEFLIGRDVMPPFEISDQAKHLQKDFDYGGYLSLRLSQFMATLIEMSPKTWLLMEFFLIFFWVIMYTTANSKPVLIWTWFGLGYLIMMCMLVLSVEARWWFEMHINPADIPCIANNFTSKAYLYFHPRAAKQEEVDASEQSPLTGNNPNEKSYSSLEKSLAVSTKHPKRLQQLQPWRKITHRTLTAPRFKSKAVDFDNLPGWCHLETEKEGRKPKWKRWIYGVGANRQQMLFDFQVNGPDFNIMLIRVLLFMHALYVALLWLKFFAEGHEVYGPIEFSCYVLFGTFPSVIFILGILNTIKNTVHTNNIGCLKSQKDVGVVLRDMKMKKAINSLILLKNLQSKLAKMNQGPDENSQEGKWRKMLETHSKEQEVKVLDEISEKMGKEKFKEFKKMFAMYDKDGGGEIDILELTKLMKSLGKVMDDNEAKQTMKALDVNGDGTVSLAEFLIWHVTQSEEKPMTPEEIAKGLFEFFDDDGSGSISASELYKKLESLDVGLTVDEITDLIKELDDDGDGNISEEEFAELLKKHAVL